VGTPRATLKQCRTLQVVVGLDGFAQAAEALNRSQSSASYNLSRPQKQLGMPIRAKPWISPRKLSPT